MKLLLLEPDKNHAQVTKKLLSDVCEVLHARSAQQAIKLADTTVVDLVVMELDLASQNGANFLYEFRTYSDWANIPVIIHTVVPQHMLDIASSVLDHLKVHAVIHKSADSAGQLRSVVEKMYAVV